MRANHEVGAATETSENNDEALDGPAASEEAKEKERGKKAGMS